MKMLAVALSFFIGYVSCYFIMTFGVKQDVVLPSDKEFESD